MWGHLGLHNPFASATSKYSMSPVKPRAQGYQIKMVFKPGEKSNHGDLWPVFLIEADQFCMAMGISMGHSKQLNTMEGCNPLSKYTD